MKRLLVLLLIVLALFAAACGGEEDEGGEEGESAATGECGELPENVTIEGLPANFPQPEGAIYTAGDEAGPSLIVEGVYDGSITESFDAYEEAFPDAGYDITKDEQEENDAEVFFAGEGTTGQVNMFSDCADQTKLRITIRPD